MLTVAANDCPGRQGGKDASASLIDEIVHEVARRMLAEALRAEVDAYVAAFAAKRDESGPPTQCLNGKRPLGWPFHTLRPTGWCMSLRPFGTL